MRILALDGGGICGLITLGFLRTIEGLLRERFGEDDLCLSDYFGLIGGTSTGAIIATCLARGMSVAEIEEKYLEFGSHVFKKEPLWRRLYRWQFRKEPIEKELATLFGRITLGSQQLKTGLVIITERADTGSTWPLINHPNGKFYQENKGIHLCDLLRASTAAPIYFEPKLIDVGNGEEEVFIDGGISMAKNPALQLFLVATLKGFPYRWPTVTDNLLLVSVGTGIWHISDDPRKIMKEKIWMAARRTIQLLRHEANWQNQMILQLISKSTTLWNIDAEVGNLAEDNLGPEKLLTYLRYDVELDEPSLVELGLKSLIPSLAMIRNMTHADNAEDLKMIGQKAAERKIQREHFPGEFDTVIDK